MTTSRAREEAKERAAALSAMWRRGGGTRRRAAAAVALLLVALVVTLGQTAPEQDTDAADRWSERLEALRPEQPVAYLELAEEMVDDPAHADDVQRGRELFALAGALDPERLGRSACLALADLETDPMEKRRLLGLAVVLDERSGGALYQPEGDADDGDANALQLVEAFSAYRLGQGRKAAELVREPAVTELLQRHGALLPGGADRFLEDARIYRGPGRPHVSDPQLIRMLQLEIALLAGDDRPWSTELALTDGRPLIEVDPDQLGRSLGVDPARPYFRDGQWVARP